MTASAGNLLRRAYGEPEADFQVRLAQLTIKEVSGVGPAAGGPANQLPGFMVRKSLGASVRKARPSAQPVSLWHALWKSNGRSETDPLSDEELANLHALLSDLAGLTPATKSGAADPPFPAAPVTFIQKFRHGGSPLPIFGENQ